MGRIVSNFFISLDGVVEAPHEWHFPYFDDAMGEVVGSGMETQKAFLLGRRLYDEWSEYWPAQSDDVPFRLVHQRRAEVRPLAHPDRPDVEQHDCAAQR